MIEKIQLYFDSFSRFTLRQIWYLFYNRVLKKLIFSSTIKEDELTDDELVTFDDFKSNLKKLNDIEWEKIFSKEQYPYPKHYTNLVEKLIEEFGKSDFINIDYFNSDDISKELQNNFQRFHLFYEIYNYKDIHKEVEFIDYWIENSSLKSIAWESFNCAIRLVNWLKMLSNINTINEDRWIKIQNSFYKQTKHIIKNIHYNVPGNHVALQYFSLWLVLKNFSNWKFTKLEIDKVEAKLTKEIESEFEKSGFHFEKSFHYHVQITLMVLIFLNMKNVLGESINTKVKDIAEKATGLIDQFYLGDNHYAMFGDNCYNFFTSNLFSDVELIKLLSKEHDAKLCKKRNSICEIENQYISVEKFGSKLIFDVGQLGLTQNPGHGHADLLSFVFSDKGRPIFIDPGVKEYSNSSESMKMKKSKYHNTISIGDSDQAFLWGFFRWAFLPKVEDYQITEEDTNVKITSSYTGFKEVGPYKHIREIILYKGKLIIHDIVYGKKSNDISLNFVLAPEVLVEVQSDKVKLMVNGLEYILVCETKNKFNLIQENIEIYRNYNTPTKSKRIVVSFSEAEFPFKSTIILKRKSPQ